MLLQDEGSDPYVRGLRQKLGRSWRTWVVQHYEHEVVATYEQGPDEIWVTGPVTPELLKRAFASGKVVRDLEGGTGSTYPPSPATGAYSRETLARFTHRVMRP